MNAELELGEQVEEMIETGVESELTLSDLDMVGGGMATVIY
jgi:hypothetical protein